MIHFVAFVEERHVKLYPLDCGSFFCYVCIFNWHLQQSYCPLCRKKIPYNSFGERPVHVRESNRAYLTSISEFLQDQSSVDRTIHVEQLHQLIFGVETRSADNILRNNRIHPIVHPDTGNNETEIRGCFLTLFAIN